MIEQGEKEGIGDLVGPVIRQIWVVVMYIRSTKSAGCHRETITPTRQHPPGRIAAGSEVEDMKVKAAMAHPSSLMRNCQRTSSLEYDSWSTAASLGSLGRLVLSE